MNRLVVAGLVGIALLTLGSILVIVLATRDGAPGPASAPGPAPVPPGAPPPGSPLAIQTLPGGAASGPPQPPPVEVWQPAPPPPPPDSWEAVPPAARAGALGQVGAAVGRELLELKPKLDACFDEDTQARFGPRPHTTVKDHAPIESAHATILMLQLEETGGAVRIVDAPVESQGTAGDGLVACAQQVLRGRVIQVPGATSGVRHRLLYPLTQ